MDREIENVYGVVTFLCVWAVTLAAMLVVACVVQKSQMTSKILRVEGNHARLLMELGFTVGEEVTIVPHSISSKLTHFQVRGVDYVLGEDSTNSIILEKTQVRQTIIKKSNDSKGYNEQVENSSNYYTKETTGYLTPIILTHLKIKLINTFTHN